MKNLKMVVFVVGVAFFAMSANAAAQNLGEVVFQQQISTTLAKSLLYHFVGAVANTTVTPTRISFDTAMSLSNVRSNPAAAPTPGTFEIIAIRNDGSVTRATSDQLTAPSLTINLVTVGGRKGLQETTSFFFTDFLRDRGAIPPQTANFAWVGYAIVNHSFATGTGLANVIDFTGIGFNISYVAAVIR